MKYDQTLCTNLESVAQPWGHLQTILEKVTSSWRLGGGGGGAGKGVVLGVL